MSLDAQTKNTNTRDKNEKRRVRKKYKREKVTAYEKENNFWRLTRVMKKKKLTDSQTDKQTDRQTN